MGQRNKRNDAILFTFLCKRVKLRCIAAGLKVFSSEQPCFFLLSSHAQRSFLFFPLASFWPPFRQSGVSVCLRPRLAGAPLSGASRKGLARTKWNKGHGRWQSIFGAVWYMGRITFIRHRLASPVPFARGSSLQKPDSIRQREIRKKKKKRGTLGPSCSENCAGQNKQPRLGARGQQRRALSIMVTYNYFRGNGKKAPS